MPTDFSHFNLGAIALFISASLLACDGVPDDEPLSQRDAALEEAPQNDIIAIDPPAPPLGVEAHWAGLDTVSVQEISKKPSLEISSDVLADVTVDVRADADGKIFEFSTKPEPLQPGASFSVPVSLSSLGVGDELQFAAMLEVKLHVTRNGHTRTSTLDPVYVHPADGGFLLYDEDVYEDTFAGGDFRDLVPNAKDGAPQADHVSVARVRTLPPGTSPKPE